ncbi:MAG: Crp/Fnr family transcriptional regulator, partial [Pseudomonadota bacterium]|nr:Crp/Fnr family transcriptional regulator [Pseudomonadota bacterium]
VELERRAVLFEAGQRIDHIYFLEAGVASIVSHEDGGEPIEVGLFGREGVSGIPVLLGAESSPHQCFMQVGPSAALRIDAGIFCDAVNKSDSLRTLLLRWVQCLMVQFAQTAIANGKNTLPERLARWLLMCHDRIEGDELGLTHEFMAVMLGVRRAGVTVTLHALVAAGAIRTTRGRLTIVDRAKLQSVAGEAYGGPEAEYRRLIGAFGK